MSDEKVIITQADNSDVLQAKIDESQARWIAGILSKTYPGYCWAVTADCKNNIATVVALKLSGTWGFYLHLDKLDPGGVEVKKAGGELLERYNVRRAKIDQDQVRDLKRDFTGNFVVDRA